MDRQAIEVSVKLYGSLRRYRPTTAEGAAHHPFTLTLATGATIHELVQQLSIANGQVNAAAINNEAVSNTAKLQDGDTVHLFPPAAGG